MIIIFIAANAPLLYSTIRQQIDSIIRNNKCRMPTNADKRRIDNNEIRIPMKSKVRGTEEIKLNKKTGKFCFR